MTVKNNDTRLLAYKALLDRLDDLRTNGADTDTVSKLTADLILHLKSTFGDKIEDSRVSQFRALIIKTNAYIAKVKRFTEDYTDGDLYEAAGPKGLGDEAADIISAWTLLLQNVELGIPILQRAYVAAKSDNRPDNPMPPKAFEGGDREATARALLRLLHQFFEDVGPMFLPRSMVEMYGRELANMVAGDHSLLTLMIGPKNRQNKVSSYYYDIRSLAVLFARLKTARYGGDYQQYLMALASRGDSNIKKWAQAVPVEERKRMEAIGKKLKSNQKLTEEEQAIVQVVTRYNEDQLAQLLRELPQLD